eukprot:scaffold36813_cov66-Attheya_sp.AAC.1
MGVGRSMNYRDCGQGSGSIHPRGRSNRDPHPTIHKYWGVKCSRTYTVRAPNPSPPQHLGWSD